MLRSHSLGAIACVKGFDAGGRHQYRRLMWRVHYRCPQNGQLAATSLRIARKEYIDSVHLVRLTTVTCDGCGHSHRLLDRSQVDFTWEAPRPRVAS